MTIELDITAFIATCQNSIPTNTVDYWKPLLSQFKDIIVSTENQHNIPLLQSQLFDILRRAISETTLMSEALLTARLNAIKNSFSQLHIALIRLNDDSLKDKIITAGNALVDHIKLNQQNLALARHIPTSPKTSPHA